MPKCRTCGAPIFFLSEEPTRTIVGGFTGNVKEVVTEYKSLPIDVDPDPAGTVAIYEVPSPNSECMQTGRRSGYKGERKRYFRRLYHEALKSFRSLGGVVYRIHFDTCPGRQR